MGISNWVKSEAEKIIRSAKGKEKIVFETGYGPSGLPHIGTFAENARTCFVIEAVKALAPSLKTTLIVFSDDYDGLRQIPKNIPNSDIMIPYLGAPLTSIPSPSDPQASFGQTNNQMLCRFLDSFDFEYDFLSSTEQYRSGVFDKGLKLVMDHYETVKTIVTKSISEEKREAWSPFIPLCETCNKFNTTSVTGYNKDRYTVEYSCNINSEEYHSCGHHGEIDIYKGKTKMGWKVDWAMRWLTFGVDYEMHGEDLSESVKISRNVCNAIGGKAPLTYKYELFLDENKQKISKKLGNGLSMEQWLKYSPLGALVYFLLGNPNTSKKMGISILPGIIDEFLSGIAKSDPADITAPLWYLKRFKKATLPNTNAKVNYNLLATVGHALGKPTPDVLFDYAARYDKTVHEDKLFYMDLCGHAAKFVADTFPPKEAFELNRSMIPFLNTIADFLQALPADKEIDGDELQKFLFSIAVENDLNQRAWFVFLYNVFLDKNSGPKMGPFFAILGKAAALEKINQKIREFQSV